MLHFSDDNWYKWGAQYHRCGMYGFTSQYINICFATKIRNFWLEWDHSRLIKVLKQPGVVQYESCILTVYFLYGMVLTVGIYCTTPACFSTLYRSTMVPSLVENSNFHTSWYNWDARLLIELSSGTVTFFCSPVNILFKSLKKTLGIQAHHIL